MKKRMRFLLPALLTWTALVWTACDSRSLSQDTTDPSGRTVSQVEVSLQNGEVFYSQSSRTAIRDTVRVLVLDAQRTAMSGVSVSCQVQSSFGGSLIPLTNHVTNSNGEALYEFRVLASDQPFEGDQEVTFVATAGNRTGTGTLSLIEQSDIQLAFLNPEDGSTIYRMEDASETMPVQVYAYRDVEVGGQTQRVGVQGVLLNFTVSTIGQGLPGVISAQGVTGADGVTGNVYYANAASQPRDTVQVRFSATIVGSTETSALSTVNLLNDYGYSLQRILPQNPQLRGDQLCQESTRFVYQYRDRNNNPISGERFNIEPSFGELTDNSMYSMTTDQAGLLTFNWKSCALEGGDLLLNITNTAARSYSYLFSVNDARPIDLSIITPVAGEDLRIDYSCDPANATTVRARMRYADDNGAIVGRTIQFSANLGEMGSSQSTDASGVASVNWHNCNPADAGQEVTISAAYLGSGNTALLSDVMQYQIDQPLGSPSIIQVTPNPPTLIYSQSTRTAVRDTVNVLVLDANRNALPNITVNCMVESEFGGSLTPLGNNMTDNNGLARYLFRVLPSDAPFEGEQEVVFRATAGGATGTGTLVMNEQSEIQLVFLNPANGTIIHRMQDATETLPVQVHAYREVTIDDQVIRQSVPDIALSFSVAAIGPGVPGVISAQGVTGADGVTNNIFYSNASGQPQDTVQVRFSAMISGNPAFSTTSTVRLTNDYGHQLTRILPQNPQLRGDQLCQEFTRFVYQYRDRNNNPIVGARFSIEPSFGELTDNSMYSMTTDQAGLLTFNWRSCALEGGDLLLNFTNTAARTYSYLFEVEDARPIDLSIITPVADEDLRIDYSCDPANATTVRARMRYADDNGAIVGRTIQFSASLGEMGSSQTTDASGVASVTWHNCNPADAGQQVTISASYFASGSTALLNDAMQYIIDQPLGSPSIIQVTPDPPSLIYSQSTRTAVRDTVNVLVLDANRNALPSVSVNCTVDSEFGGALTPLSNNMTDINGLARYLFRVLPSDAPFEGEQEVVFRATAGGATGEGTLVMNEQSEVQLVFLNPANGTIIHRMQDAAETLPVQVYAYRDITINDQVIRQGVPDISLSFAVVAIGPGVPGVITVQGITGNDGVTNNVFYSNASAQPQDTVQVRFSAMISGNPSFSTTSTVRLTDDFGHQLIRVLPQTVNLRGDQLCQDSTRFMYQYKDLNNNPIAGARFNVEPSFGELLDNTQYSQVTDDAGMISFSWRSCALEGGDLVLALVHSSGRAYNFLHEVADARPIDLTIISPVPGGELEIDSECLDENVTSVRASLRYSDTNAAIVGRTVSFAANFGQLGASALSDGNGVAAVTWHDCDESHAGQTLNLSAALLNSSNTPILQVNEAYPVDLPVGTPHHISLSIANSVLPDPVDGSLQTQVTATVFNSQNQRLGAGVPLGFRTNGIGQITAGAFTNDTGQAFATFNMNNQTGVSNVRAYFASGSGAEADTLWSNVTTVTVNSGLPVNVTLTTATPRIQILGFGTASQALVTARVVDASGALVTMDVPVKFFLQASPVECFLSTPGMDDQHFLNDTLTVTSQNGNAQMVINSGRRPGVVQVGVVINDMGLDVYSSYPLVTIVAGPPAYGTLDFDPIGEQVGASMWRVTWAAHFWDRYSNDVKDSTAVYFFLDPPNLASMDGYGLTGFDADDQEDLRGVAKDYMLYHCQAIGGVIDTSWACTAGEVPQYDNPFDPLEITGWEPGNVCVFKQTPDGTAQFQLPFQPGDRDDNLTLEVSTDQVVFPMLPCPGLPQPIEVTVRATLRDGYTCLVSNQLIQFWASNGGTFDPAEGITDVNGQVTTTLIIDPSVLENTGTLCDDDTPPCYRYNPYNLSFGAIRQPGGPSSDVGIIQVTRPCD
jgi:hypothetical protein